MEATFDPKLKPFDDVLIVQPLAAEEMSAGGIVYPDTAEEQKKATTGLVLASGLGRFSSSGVRLPNEAKVGEKVMFLKNAGTEIKIDGNLVRSIRNHECLCVID